MDCESIPLKNFIGPKLRMFGPAYLSMFTVGGRMNIKLINVALCPFVTSLYSILVMLILHMQYLYTEVCVCVYYM